MSPEDASPVSPPDLRVVVITGMSGGGRRTCAHVLEDLGWYVVDNLPPRMLRPLVAMASEQGITRVAAVVDVRTRALFEQLPSALAELTAGGPQPEIVYMEADEDVLVRRHESVRRPHPLQGEGRLLDGIRRERERLATVRAAADLVVDTSTLTLHQLGNRITHAFSGDGDADLRVTVLSFGFKHGLPVDADMVFDVRFLPNPHWVPELRPRTGLDAPVRDFVLGQTGADAWFDQTLALLDTVATGYVHEGKRFATVAVGCTGGKHRSTAMATELGRRLAERGVPTTVIHRDLGLE